MYSGDRRICRRGDRCVAAGGGRGVGCGLHPMSKVSRVALDSV